MPHRTAHYALVVFATLGLLASVDAGIAEQLNALSLGLLVAGGLGFTLLLVRLATAALRGGRAGRNAVISLNLIAALPAVIVVLANTAGPETPVPTRAVVAAVLWAFVAMSWTSLILAAVRANAGHRSITVAHHYRRPRHARRARHLVHAGASINGS